MKTLVKDIMVTDFDIIDSQAPMELAIKKILNGRIRATGDKTASLLVLDNVRMFVGIITMADILYHVRPPFLNYGISGEEVAWSEQLDRSINDLKQKRVGELMSTNIVGASKEEHIMVTLDRMVKNKYHRLPVLDNGRPIGVVYIADIYYHLFS